MLRVFYLLAQCCTRDLTVDSIVVSVSQCHNTLVFAAKIKSIKY